MSGKVPVEQIDQLRGFATQLDLRPGCRLASWPAVLRKLVSPNGAMATLASTLLDRPARAVRALIFDKTADCNWAVPWHQDRTIVVDARAEIPDFGPWSQKADETHVEPPADVLANMVALRLHLDDCDASNGPLLAIRGSWRLGRVATTDIAEAVATGEAVTLVAETGDVVAMRGLTLHASRPSLLPSRRRVIHIDFSANDLPQPLSWRH